MGRTSRSNTDPRYLPTQSVSIQFYVLTSLLQRLVIENIRNALFAMKRCVRLVPCVGVRGCI